MKPKAKGELAYKPILDLVKEEPIHFDPLWYKTQLTPHDDAITLIISQHPITRDRTKLNVPPLNVMLIDDKGNQKMLVERLSNVCTIEPCFVAPDWDYELYLKSQEWEERRSEYFSEHGKRCSICGSNQTIQLHHLNYKRLGYEKDSDLICLCSECHKLLHLYKDQYIERIGDLARMWFYPTRNIDGANTNNDLINRFIAKYKPQLDYVFDNLPPIEGRVKTKFASQLLSSMRSRYENKLLPFHMIVKLIKSK